MNKNGVTDAIHAVFNKNPNIKIIVDGIRDLDGQKTEITVYVKEQKADGSSRKLLASELAAGLNQQVS
jgi:hypothetical protein